MAKKLTKKIEGTIVTITHGEEVKTYDFAKLPKEIQTAFGPFGLGHKLGDSAAGKEGADVFGSIDKVWGGLMAGDWTVRAPAAERVSKKDIKANVDKLPEDKKKKAMELLKSIGIEIG